MLPASDWWSDLIDTSDVLAEADVALLAEWRGDPDPADAEPADQPPLTVRLAHLGRAFADSAGTLAPERRRRALAVVERVLASGSDADRDAMATGFVEALLAAWDTGFELAAIWPELGPETRAYGLAWNRFAGVESPAWMRGS